MIYTVGHSTRGQLDFLELLCVHDVCQLADVRSVPRSRRHPHFGGEALDAFLSQHGIRYRHFPELGGRRRPARDSPNTAWREEGFRGYADYMSTPAFVVGVESLIQFAEGGVTAVMCAESVWWKCHRRLLADALLVRGIPVLHIVSSASPKAHELSEFASVEGTSVTYSGLL